MGRQPAPIHRLRKLFRSLFQLRVARNQYRERLPFEFRFRHRQKEISERAKKEWRGGYILDDDGDFIYVPAQMDITVLERLTYKPAPEPIIAKVCPPGGTVMDVGANLGDWTLPMAKAVGPSGRVFAFEPVPFVAQSVKKTLKINGFANAEVVETALSDCQGETAFTVVHDENAVLNIRCSGIGIDDLGGFHITVSTTTLDAFAEAEKLERLDFIKVDVEGHESAVFKGAVDTLEKFRPAIVFEAGFPHEKEADRQSIRDTLSGAGYSLIGMLIEHGVVEADWDSYVAFSDPFDTDFYCNVLCLHSG
jgi:FkbM family methyltransferase